MQQQQQPNATMQMLNKDEQDRPKGKRVHHPSFLVGQNGIKGGQYMQYTFGKYYLVVTEEGNMACYSHYSCEPQYMYWQTGTWGGAGCEAFVDKQGNFCLVGARGGVLWQNSTHNQVKAITYKLKIHDDGHLELTGGTKVIWKTSPGPKK